jgi:threonine dehydrogenase-like Zn-dependent dehydrogenase
MNKLTELSLYCWWTNSKQVIHPGDMCFKLPENVSLEEGAMCEPLSVGVHACQRASIGPNTKVLIMGAGPIGLVTLLAAHAFGSPKVVIADISPERLKVAEELGANASVVLSTNDSVRASGDSSRDSFTLYSLLFSNLYKHIVRQFPD